MGGEVIYMAAKPEPIFISKLRDKSNSIKDAAGEMRKQQD
jgi:hypothetical protein